ncbi:MAG: hypothetical protein R6W48_11065 [Gaiellaceae bacterium]
MQATTTTTRAGSYRMASTGLFLLAAAASFVLSVSLWFSGNEQQGIFVGLWVPSILALGALLRPAERRR